MARPTPDFITDLEEANESLLIHDIARLMKKAYDKRVRSIGLTRAQWQALGTLRRHPGLSQAQLADRLDVKPITIARTVDRLEKAGWIERKRDPKDRRINRLYLTARVKDVVSRMRAQGLELRTEAMHGMNRQEHDVLLSALTRMKNNLSTKKKAARE